MTLNIVLDNGPSTVTTLKTFYSIPKKYSKINYLIYSVKDSFIIRAVEHVEGVGLL